MHDVDAQFVRLLENLRDPDSPVATFFLLQSHAAYRAAVGLAMSTLSEREAKDPRSTPFPRGRIDFENDYVDTGHEKRYRESYAFPGIDLNEVGGRNFLKSMVELNLAPMRFAHAGTPGFRATWMRPALFTTALVTNVDAPSARRALVNARAQIDIRLSVLSVLEMTPSIGGGIAFEQGQHPRRQAMFSVKVLR